MEDGGEEAPTEVSDTLSRVALYPAAAAQLKCTLISCIDGHSGLVYVRQDSTVLQSQTRLYTTMTPKTPLAVLSIVL